MTSLPSSRPRAIFFGTPELAVPALVALTELADVVAVVCQPDKPVGRESTPVPPAVKVAALARGIPVNQPTKVRTPELAAWVREQRADLALVLAYGRILVKDVLEAPRLGCLNLHASLLPRYRGAAPITWCIVRGERETGVCLMQMDEGLDTGPVRSTHRIPIGDDETAGELAPRIAELAAKVVREDLPRVLAGELPPVPQDDAAATFAPILKKEDGRVTWTAPARALHDHVRGMQPWPGAFTQHRGKLLKILRTQLAPGAAGAPPGTVVAADRSGILVATGDGLLGVLRAQLEGRKALDAHELVAGRSIAVGDVLG